MDAITPVEAVEMYLQDRQADSSDLTVQTHRSRLSHFEEWCDEEGIDNMNDLTGRKLHEYRIWRRNKPDPKTGETPKNTTMKGQMDTVRVFTRWCETIDAVPPGLSEKVLSPSLSKHEDEREEMLDPAVGDELLKHLAKYEYANREHIVFVLIWRGLLRRGGARAIDIRDVETEGEDPRIRIRHRPDTDTPLKNKFEANRQIGIRHETAAVIEDYTDQHRHDVTDDHDRESLLTTANGRPHAQTVQADAYAVTRPCKGPIGECPHDRDVEACDAARDRQEAYQCPSSRGPHAIRRGAITRWLDDDVPTSVVSDRCSTSEAVLDAHYDQRSERRKQQQRREYLDW